MEVNKKIASNRPLIVKILQALVLLFFAAISFIAIFNTRYSAYENWNLAVGLLGMFFTVFLFLYNKKTSTTSRVRIFLTTIFELKYLPILLILVSFAIQLVVVFSLATDPLSIGWDGRIIFSSAKAMASGAPIGDEELYYFGVYPFNMLPTYILSLWFKIWSLIGVHNYLGLTLILNVIFMQAALLMLYLTVKNLYGKIYGIFAILLGGIFISLSPHVRTFYTDTVGIFFPIAILYVYIKLRNILFTAREGKAWRLIFLSAAFALLLVVGIAIKKYTLSIAFALILFDILPQLLNKQVWLVCRRNLLIGCSVALTVAIVGSLFIGTSLAYRVDGRIPRDIAVPMSHYVMMGLSKDCSSESGCRYGAWNQNDIDFMSNNIKSGKYEEIATSETAGRLDELGLSGAIKFILAKGAWVIGDGTFYAYGEGSEHTAKPLVNNIISREMFYGGVLYSVYKALAQFFWLVILLIIVAYIVIRLFILQKIKVNRYTEIALFAAVGAVGISVLLEGRSRYLYSSVPIFIVAALGITFSIRQALSHLKAKDLTKKVVDIWEEKLISSSTYIISNATLLKRMLIKNKWLILAYFSVLIALTLFVVWYVMYEKTVYFWDGAGYWLGSGVLYSSLSSAPISTLINIANTVSTSEYNSLYALPLMPFQAIFGASRLAYILGVFFVYFVPATLLVAIFITKIIPRKSFMLVSSKWYLFVCWCLVALNPFMLAPVVSGYPDAIGLIPIFSALLIYINVRKNLLVRYMILIGLLLFASSIIRRWYIFSAVGILLFIGLDQLMFAVKSKKYVRTLSVALTAPLTFAAVYIVIAYPYIASLVGTDYQDKYAAYRPSGGYVGLLGLVVNHYGLIFIVATVAGLVAMYVYEKKRLSQLVLLAVVPLFCFFAVGRIQVFDLHQYYLLTPALLTGFFAFIVYSPAVYRKTRLFKSRNTIMTMSLIAVLGVVYLPNYLYLFGIQENDRILASNPQNYCKNLYCTPIKRTVAYSNTKAPPKRRDDANRLTELYKFVESIDVTDSNESNTVYVLACSTTLNIDLFKNIPVSLSPNLEKIQQNEFTPSALFDVAQGFDKKFFSSKVIVDSTPVGYITQYPEEQSIITYLHNQLQEGGVLQEYYSLVKEAELVKGYKAQVYVQKRSIPSSIMEDMVDQIKTFHENIPIYE